MKTAIALTQRDKQVLELAKKTTVTQKYTYRQIGEKLGISGQRVGQIIKKLQRKGVNIYE